MAVGTKANSGNSLRGSINSYWPGFRYLGLGLLFAWMLLFSDTGTWLSDIEADGSLFVNSAMLSKLNIAMYPAAGASLILLVVLQRFSKKFAAFFASRWNVFVIGLLGAVGALLIILSGPYFILGPLQLNIDGAFRWGSVICGITLALLVVKCSYVFGDVEPYKALIFCLLSELVVVVIYWLVSANSVFVTVEGAPPISGIVALSALPFLSAVVLSIGDSKRSSASDQDQADGAVAALQASGEVEEDSSDRNGYGYGSLIRFYGALFLFSVAVAFSLQFCAANLTPLILQVGSKISVDVLLALVGVFLILVVSRLKTIPLAQICLLATSVIAVVLALCPLLGLNGLATYVLVTVISSFFEIFIWVMFAFISYRKVFPRVNIFAIGFGVSCVGKYIGWMVSHRFLSTLAESGLDTAVYVFVALAVVLMCMFVFAGKDFSILFSSTVGEDLSLKTNRGLKGLFHAPDEEKRSRPWKEACHRICENANLSQREEEIFRLLAMGNTAEAIADKLSISASTARSHIHNIYGKLDVHSKQEILELINAEQQRA